MGTSGPGNFDDDGAFDWLHEDIVSPLVETIKDGLRDHDESNGTSIAAAIEVLCVLCENVPANPPKPAEVDAWRAKYLEAWNSYIDDLRPQPGFKEERLRVINATFDRLAAVSKKRHQ